MSLGNAETAVTPSVATCGHPIGWQAMLCGERGRPEHRACLGCVLLWLKEQGAPVYEVPKEHA